MSGEGQPGGRATAVTPSDARIVIAEDEGMIRYAFAKPLSLEPDGEVIAHVGDGQVALAAVHEHDPDVLVTDIEMPQLTGLNVAEVMHDVQLRTRVLVLTDLRATGLPTGEIASTLQLAEGTVRNYLSDAMGKLGARTHTRPPTPHATTGCCDSCHAQILTVPTGRRGISTSGLS